jgi:hypothetical protein
MYPLFTSKDSPAERLPVAECHDTAPPASFNFDRYPAAMILPSAHVSARAARHAGHHAHGGQGGALPAAHHAGALALLFVHTRSRLGGCVGREHTRNGRHCVGQYGDANCVHRRLFSLELEWLLRASQAVLWTKHGARRRSYRYVNGFAAVCALVSGGDFPRWPARICRIRSILRAGVE